MDASQRIWYKNNREKILQHAAEYRKQHKEYYRDYSRKRSILPEVRDRETLLRKTSKIQVETRKQYSTSDARKRDSKRYRDENRQKCQAQWHVWKACKDGKLVRPSTCDVCGHSHTKIHAHHHKGYEKEHRLDVLWLCPECHGIAHRKSQL